MTDIQVFGSHEPNTLEQLRDVFVSVTKGVLAQEYFHVQAK